MNYSIVITTYNGAKYLLEQLDSIRLQTIPPDEVLIFDDRSTDSTPKLIIDYIDKNELSWNFVINDRNLGWKRNFMQGISKATGNIVFLSDQDDVWLLDKCEKMLEIMKNIPRCNLLMSNYKPVFMDERNKSSFGIKRQSNNRKVMKIPCNAKRLFTVYRPGCTYCLRKDFFNSIEDYWYDEVAHDRYIYNSALISDSVYLYNYRAIIFRRHNRNNSPKNIRTSKNRISGIEYLEKLFNVFFGNIDLFTSQNQDKSLEGLNRVLEFCQYRDLYYKSPTLVCWFKGFIRYHKIYPSFRSIFSDLYIVLRKR
ncbi:MAG: glycosyltransferase [Peptostreptococcaceae bacterium]|nr:glycosyltransferase [Peptostreptococcaceae bacterium]